VKKSVAFISGNFNVVHPGHLRLFRYAREKADRVIVGVFSDRLGGDQIFIAEALRVDALKNNVLVDEVRLIDSDIASVLTELKPDLVIKGHEHASRFNVEDEIVRSFGGELLFNSGESAFSAVDLIQREFRTPHARKYLLPNDFMERRNVDVDSIRNALNRFSGISVTVVGDLLIDEYVTCEPVGMSREEPTVVVTPVDRSRFVGGAGIVAAHAASLGAQVTFVSVCGDDDVAHFAQSELARLGVQTRWVQDTNINTLTKTRFRSQGRNLLRVNSGMSVEARAEHGEQMVEMFASSAATSDLVMFSDFNMGCLTPEVVMSMLASLPTDRPFVSADSQVGQGFGSIAKFRGIDLVTPTEGEARAALRDEESGLAALAERLRDELEVANVLLTLGKEGVLISGDRSKLASAWPTDRLPALNLSPVDVAGAGDCLLVVMSLALVSGTSLWEASLMASVAAAVQVSRVGNLPVTRDEILDAIA
jgi:rfaE bifunctional protein kinase chain/domain